MKQLLTLILMITLSSGHAQNSKKFNLGFENQRNEDQLSGGWIKWGNYELSIEEMGHAGTKSGKITSDKAGISFGSIAYKIPANYKGKTIQLRGFMKIENVENGFAGLLMRIDGNGAPLAFDNMQSQNVTGTKDWQEYTITLNYPEEAENIFMAGILVGKGQAWFDDFVVTIDGKNIQTLKEVEQEVLKAQLDKEFDKGSLVEINELFPNTLENLELLGRIWGFLKYHHPAIGTGNYNWDYELFRILPSYLEPRKEEERDKLLVDWIDSLGKLKECTTCQATDKDAFLKPDMQWVENQSTVLKERLRSVYAKRHQGKHFYIGMAPNVGNPDFKHENAYPKMSFPDDGFRLLSLYRYWNMIQYFFPYKHLMDKNWDLTLKEYIPKFLNAKNELEYEFAAIQLIGDIQDTHANLWAGADKIEAWKGNYFSPVHVRFIENQLVVTDFYNPELKQQTGLAIGDVITTVNGKTIEQIVTEQSKYYPASNEPTRLRDISADILRSNEKEVTISYVRNGEQMNNQLTLYPRDSLNIYRWYRRNDNKCYKLLEGNIGYITLQSIKDEDIPEIKEKFKGTKGIIMDIRNYPSTFVPFKLGAYFISTPTAFVKFTSGSTDNPGEFTFTNELKIPNERESYKGKLIVLVNELSQSQAEYTAMAFKAGNNTTIIGSTTAGADGNVSTIFLPGGLRTMISGIGVYYPNGEETQRVGIVPDIEVKPTVEGIKNGKDELLEKAIELILEE
ncbi:MAG: S41 family peptidase [Bacteroidota bacterium]